MVLKVWEVFRWSRRKGRPKASLEQGGVVTGPGGPKWGTCKGLERKEERAVKEVDMRVGEESTGEKRGGGGGVSRWQESRGKESRGGPWHARREVQRAIWTPETEEVLWLSSTTSRSTVYEVRRDVTGSCGPYRSRVVRPLGTAVPTGGRVESCGCGAPHWWTVKREQFYHFSYEVVYVRFSCGGWFWTVSVKVISYWRCVFFGVFHKRCQSRLYFSRDPWRPMTHEWEWTSSGTIK